MSPPSIWGVEGAWALEDAAEASAEFWDPATSPYNAAQRAWLALGISLRPQTENTLLRFDGRPGEPPRCWPSTLQVVQRTLGGWYGVTAFGAEGGAGKTMLGISCLMEAAASGDWQVVGFVAEDDYDGLADRVNRYLDAWPAAADAIGRINLFSVGKGATPQRLFDDVSSVIDTELDLPVLIGLDSINTIATFSPRGYLEALRELGEWAMFSRRISRGAVSWQLVAETNQRGGLKGVNLEYWSDVVLKMYKVEGQRGIVRLKVQKTRRTEGEADLGKFVRDFRRGRFLTEWEAAEVARPLRVVGRDELDF